MISWGLNPLLEGISIENKVRSGTDTDRIMETTKSMNRDVTPDKATKEVIEVKGLGG